MVARQEDQTRLPRGPFGMNGMVDANVGTTPVRDAHRFAEAAFAAWMKANVEGFEGPLTVEQFTGGQSNPTYKLLTPSRSYVLRRKPPGQLLKGAPAVERGAQVLIDRKSTRLNSSQ